MKRKSLYLITGVITLCLLLTISSVVTFADESGQQASETGAVLSPDEASETEVVSSPDETSVAHQASENDGGKSELLAALLGAIIGGVFSLVGIYLTNHLEKKKQEKHSAAVLFYDLESICKFVNDNSGQECPDIRYTDGWLSAVLSCSNLEPEQVKQVFEIYDDVYDYNYYRNIGKNDNLAEEKFNNLKKHFVEYSQTSDKNKNSKDYVKLLKSKLGRIADDNPKNNQSQKIT